MDPARAAVDPAWTLAAWAVAAVVLALAARRVDWRSLTRGERVHPWLGSVLFLVFLWSIGASIGGISLHFLCVGALCLLAGPAYALAAGAVVVAVTTLWPGAPPGNAGLVYVTLVAVPVAVQCAVLALVRRLLPRNPFAWFFFVAFLGGGASFVAGALAGSAFAKPPGIDWSELAILVAMLGLAEGTMTGMLLTLAVVYRPGWVATFDDARDLEAR